MKSDEIVDIPITHNSAKDQGTPNISKWKKGTVKKNTSRGQGKQTHTYTRNRRIPEHDRDIAAKKFKDKMEVDSIDNTIELAEVGQGQPRQSL